MLVVTLSTPLLAISLGLAIGVGLLTPLVWSLRLPTAGKTDVGFVLVPVAVIGGLVIAFGLMWGYRSIAPAGFKYFALAVVSGYLAALGTLVVIAATRLLRSSKAARDKAPIEETRS